MTHSTRKATTAEAGDSFGQKATSLNRRQFLGTSGSAIFTIGFTVSGLGLGDEAHAATQAKVNAWLSVGSNEAITMNMGPCEMGQGSQSSLAQLLAEDLMVSFDRITMVQAGPNLTSSAVGTAIVAAGSGVIRNNYWKFRNAAAQARETLVLAAINRIGDFSRSNYSVANGVVSHVSGQTLSYGALAAQAALLTPVLNAPLVPDAQFKIIGQSLPRLDIPLKVDGSAKYGIDARVPGMVFAVIKHCPTFGGVLASPPTKPGGAMAVIPVNVGVSLGRGAELSGNVNAVAVVAATTWDAMQAARSLKLSWTLPANAANWNDAQFFADAAVLATGGAPFVAGAANLPGTVFTVEKQGDPIATLAAPPIGQKVLESTYKLPYVAHACMEVLNCTVDLVPGVSCTVYAPTQAANAALTRVMLLTGLAADKITFITTMLGGGLGRKIELDFISQAVQVAVVLQKPVQLVWPREEDFTHDQYRPMALVKARAALDATGNISAWAYRNVSPSIRAQRGAVLPATGDSQGYESSQNLPYDMGGRVTEWVQHPSPVPVGYWRSVGASINTFAIESMMDEMAAAAGLDPVQFRRGKLASNPRWLNVLEMVANLGKWTSPAAKGTARGFAIGPAFNSICASVVEISGTSTTSFKVTRVAIVLDPYLTVNPANVEAQLVGGMVHGLNAALYGQQTFVNGVAQRKNFNSNKMIRLQEMPLVSVAIVPRPVNASTAVPIGGVGELGVPSIAPAIANALFRLTGQRLRNLPLLPNATAGG